MEPNSNPGFFRNVFTEADGSPSMENILSVGGFVFGIIWISFIVFKTWKLPEAGALASLTGFCAIHHFSNKLAGAFGNKS